MLKAYGRGTWVWSFFTSDLASLYAGAFFQLTTGLMGESSMWIFYKASYFGAVGFKETSFHLVSFGMMSLHSLMAVLTMRCSLLVVSCGVSVKLLLAMKF